MMLAAALAYGILAAIGALVALARGQSPLATDGAMGWSGATAVAASALGVGGVGRGDGRPRRRGARRDGEPRRTDRRACRDQLGEPPPAAFVRRRGERRRVARAPLTGAREARRPARAAPLDVVVYFFP